MSPHIVLNPRSSLRPILVVEDNDMDLDFCLQAFEEHHIANPVIACRDGDEAIQFIDAHSDPLDPGFPLLMLLDWRLPKVDGIDVLRHAREVTPWQQVPIVVLSTSGQSADVQASYQQGVNAYIVKPVDFSAFSKVIKHIKIDWILSNEAPIQVSGRD